MLLERYDAGGDPLIGVRKRFGQIFADSFHISASLSESYSGLQSADAVDAQSCPSLQEQRIAPLTNGYIYVALAKSRNRQMEVRGDHAYDRVRLRVQRDALSQDVPRRAELSLPQSCADQGNRTRTDFIFASRKRAPNNRVHAQL